MSTEKKHQQEPINKIVLSNGAFIMTFIINEMCSFIFFS